MKLSALHPLIKKEVKNEIACAIRLDWITSILAEQVRQTNNLNYQYPTTDAKIAAGLKFDITNFKVNIIPDGISIEGFHPIIQIREPKKIHPNPDCRNYNTVGLEYSVINAKIEIINGTAKIVIPDLNKIPAPTMVIGIPDPKVIQDNNLTIDDYKIKEQAIIFQSLYLEILDQFVDSITVPNALPAMSLLKLQPPYKYFYFDDYIAITGVPEIVFDEHCECRTSSIQRSERRNPAGADITGQKLTYPGPPDIIDVDDPVAFFYIPQTPINIVSDNILNPAITASDEGDFMLFKWYWNLALTIKSLNIQLDPSNLKIIINSTLGIFGNAGVALKVGCVYQRIVSANLIGKVDPSRVELTLEIDNGNNVMLNCNYTYKIDINLSFLTDVDVLINPVLNSVLNNLGKDKYEARLKLFNNKFLDLNNILLRPNHQWKISKNFDADSICIGIQEWVNG